MTTIEELVELAKQPYPLSVRDIAVKAAVELGALNHEIEALTRQVEELKGRVIDHHYSGCPDCNEIINRIDNDWLDGIAKLWNERHPGKIYGVRDGETREEWLSANLSFIFDELDDSQSSLALSQEKVESLSEQECAKRSSAAEHALLRLSAWALQDPVGPTGDESRAWVIAVIKEGLRQEFVVPPVTDTVHESIVTFEDIKKLRGDGWAWTNQWFSRLMDTVSMLSELIPSLKQQRDALQAKVEEMREAYKTLESLRAKSQLATERMKEALQRIATTYPCDDEVKNTFARETIEFAKQSLSASASQLLEELDGLRRDKERLDWLEKTAGGDKEGLSIGGICYWSVWKPGKRRLGEGDDLRQAIDSAISNEGKGL